MNQLGNGRSGKRDFDFLVGDWIVNNQRMPEALTGSSEWETFEARLRNCPLPAGIGNMDDFVSETWRPGFVGLSFRIFNPKTNLWSIYWLNNRDGGIDAATGALTAPVVGEFRDGVGNFEAADTFGGRSIRVRYTWSEISNVAARWQQAFSPDDGHTWETNWIMEMTRVDTRHANDLA